MKTLYKSVKGEAGIVEIPEPRELNKGEVLIEGKLCGFCKSDIETINGHNDIPVEKFGHEGVGIIKKSKSRYWKEGTIVASWGDGCYADYYIANEEQIAQVQEASPNYIVQPLATMINVARKAKGSILVNGCGSNAILLAKYLRWAFDFIGEHNVKQMSEYGHYGMREKEYDTVIEISGKQNAYNEIINYVKDGGLILAAANPPEPVELDLFKYSWKAVEMKFPSPRDKDFGETFRLAARLLNEKEIDISDVFQKGYKRENANEAIEGRKKYIKTYLYW